MSSLTNDSRLQNLINLLEKRTQHRDDVDLETKFFNDALEYLLSVNHWWCSSEKLLSIARESLWLFSLPDHDPIVQYKTKLNLQLKSCAYCAKEYQISKISVRKRYEDLFPQHTVDQFFHILNQFDLTRIKSTLKQFESVSDGAVCALLEIVYNQQLLSDAECDDLFCSMFNHIQQTGLFPTLDTDTAVYLFRLSLHHHRIVRFWTRKLLEKFIQTEQCVPDESLEDLCKDLLRSLADGTALQPPFPLTEDVGERWKTLRLIATTVTSDILHQSLLDAQVSMTLLIRRQLSTSSEWLGEILKTMTIMLLKLQSKFWGTIENDWTVYYDIIKQICEHHVFQSVMKIAREGNVGKILQKDGTRYPEDKLIAKIKGILEWMYPYWSSLRQSPVESQMTEKILDTTFGYFQMDTWGVMSRAYCAELGLQIIDQCLSDDRVPMAKIEEYVPKMVSFAKIDASSLPVIVQHMPRVALNILDDLADKHSSSVISAFQSIFQASLGEAALVKDIRYQAIWNALMFHIDREPSPCFVNIILKAYAAVATVDLPDLAQQANKSALPAQVSFVAEQIHNIHVHVIHILPKIPPPQKIESDLIKPILHLHGSQYTELRAWVMQTDSLDPFNSQPSDQLLEAINAILQEYIILFNTPLDIFKSIPGLTNLLRFYLPALTKNEKPASAHDLGSFWDACWKTSSYVFDKGLTWAESYKPREVVDTLIPMLDIATGLMDVRSWFEQATSPDNTLSYSHVCSSVDFLSQWVYVTRQDVISRLQPLLIALLDTLKKMEMKVSVDAYDRLMTAATGVNACRLSATERERLFMALSAHEPANFIFLNDSDDEEVEWQPINTTASNSPARDQVPSNSHSATQSKITSFFGASEENPQVISDDEFDAEYGEIDIAQIVEKGWLDSTPKEEEKKKDLKPKAVKIEIPTRNREERTESPKRHVSRVYVPQTKQQTYAVTSTGRKLKPPPMGFSKLKNLREEFKAEQRLMATVKSPSSVVNRRYSDHSSSDSSDDDGEGGLEGLVNDMDHHAANIKAESASVKALFDTKPKRTIKLIETPITNEYLQRKEKRVKAQIRKQKITPNIDGLYKAILTWDVTINSESPPSSGDYERVPTTFSSFKDYRASFEPLLIAEAWAQIQRAKEGLSASDVLEQCSVTGRCHTNDFVDITFALPMNMITNNISVDDLVCVANHFGSAFFNDPSQLTDGSMSVKPWKGRAFLGKINSINQTKNMGEVSVRAYFGPDRISILNSLSPKTVWSMLRIMSLTTAMREYAALEGLEHYDLGPEILSPTPTTMKKPSTSVIQQYCTNYNVNEPQAEAIASAIQKKKGFSLIQGPPGTGKTKTILALIVSLLDQRQGYSKLLVCAPSNAAVDEITKRLKEGVMTAQGIKKPNVVRIGVADSVNASVKDRILDRLIEAEMEAKIGNDATMSKMGARLDTLHSEIRNLQIGLDDVDREITQAGSDMVQMSILRSKRKALGAKLTKAKMALRETYQDQKNYGQEMEVSRVRARQKVFANADVVCATLSGSGHDMLTSMGASFETVIVDEAAQSIEISSLIPLKFDTQRCILVGDPNQLPPTVMSTVAAKYDYQQSLFMRLEKTVGKEVNLLSIQYRMHPEISTFPSKLFYQSRLQDGPGMDKISSAIWHALPEFPPYCFYDVRDGQEKMGRGKSIFNVAEADAAVCLVDLLLTKLPTIKFASKIGVITPYKQQVGQLKARFQKRFGNGIVDAIDFNTVDGFQGQEKEIVIFSCVRAGSGRGIGFLADMRRMNVGLTRAKCSLFVLGHARSLSRSEYWGDLVRDAEKRSLIRECGYPYFQHRMNGSKVPQNIYEKDAAALPSTQSITYAKGPIKIHEPHSPRLGDKRSSSPMPENSRSASRQRVSSDEQSFIEKVRSLKEARVQQGQRSQDTNEAQKISMNEYRAMRGLPPMSGRSNRMTDKATSNLFIKKPLPARSKRPEPSWSDGLSARDKAVLDVKNKVK
ncbi:hypothetical protein G6F58_006718 [Rhizopus delemar]|nr:hypothetical protein G6F58_006718 [Rhizopus delemar]